jgi:hypothetical protein
MVKQKGTAILSVIILGLLLTTVIMIYLNATSIGSKAGSIRRNYINKHYETEYARDTAVQWIKSNINRITQNLQGVAFSTCCEKVSPFLGSGINIWRDLETVITRKNIKTPVVFFSGSHKIYSTFPNVALVNEFSNIDFGDKRIQVTLIGGKGVDIGGIEPVFRVDALPPLAQSGPHLHSIVKATLPESNKQALHGNKQLTVNVNCDSYNSATGLYGVNNRLSGCRTETTGFLTLKRAYKIYGEAYAKRGLKHKKSGSICSDNPDCRFPGYTCLDSTCVIPELPKFEEWSKLCPNQLSGIRVRKNQTIILTSSINVNCWSDIRVDKDGLLQITASEIPYHIANLDIRSGGKIEIVPSTGNLNIAMSTSLQNEYRADIKNDKDKDNKKDIPVATATSIPTATRQATAIPVPTATRQPTATPLPTATVTRLPTATPLPTSTPQPTATVKALDLNDDKDKDKDKDKEDKDKDKKPPIPTATSTPMPQPTIIILLPTVTPTPNTTGTPKPNINNTTIWISRLKTNAIDTRRFINTTKLPTALTINLLQHNTVRIIGTNPFYGKIVAPKAFIQVRDKVEFFGWIIAESLTLSSKFPIHLDEALEKDNSIIEREVKIINEG